MRSLFPCFEDQRRWAEGRVSSPGCPRGACVMPWARCGGEEGGPLPSCEEF